MKFDVKISRWNQWRINRELNEFIHLCGIREIEALGDTNPSLREALRTADIAAGLGYKRAFMMITLDIVDKWSREEIEQAIEDFQRDRKSYLSEFRARQKDLKKRGKIEKRMKRFAKDRRGE